MVLDVNFLKSRFSILQSSHLFCLIFDDDIQGIKIAFKCFDY